MTEEMLCLAFWNFMCWESCLSRSITKMKKEKNLEKINLLDQSYSPRRYRSLDRGLLIADLDWTIACPVSDLKFINTPQDQQLMPNVGMLLQKINQLGYSVYLTSNQGGIEAGHLTLKTAIAKMRYLFCLSPYIQRIYFAKNDCEVWVIKRGWGWLDVLPRNINHLGRYVCYSGMGDDPKYWLSGFRKPHAGMLRLALYDWINKYDLLEGTIEPQHWIKEICFELDLGKYFGENAPNDLLCQSVFYTGDRDEDEQAARNAKLPFLPASEFHNGNILAKL